MSEKVLNNLATDLFVTFSRFEYALKHTGFHKGDGDAQPNWRRFALSVDPKLMNSSSTELGVAIDYLLQHPPKKQVIRNGLLEWKEAKPNTNSKADLVLLYVRRVRNNLFHGGKFNGHWFVPERSEKLLRCSLVTLNACLKSSSDVRETYNSPHR